MYIYICICINIYIYNHTHTCMCIYIYIHTYTNTHMHTPAHTRERSPSGTYRYISYIYHMYAYTEYVYTHVRIRIHIHIFVYIHGYMYINTPAHTRERSPSAHIRARPLATPRQPSRTSCHLRVCVTHGGGGGGGGYSLTSTRNSTPAVTQDLSPACMGKWRRVKRALCPMLYVLFVSQTNSTASTQQSPTHYTHCIRSKETHTAQKSPTHKMYRPSERSFFWFFWEKKSLYNLLYPLKRIQTNRTASAQKSLTHNRDIYCIHELCDKIRSKEPYAQFSARQTDLFFKKNKPIQLAIYPQKIQDKQNSIRSKEPCAQSGVKLCVYTIHVSIVHRALDCA